MAHFAKVNPEGLVLRVIKIEPEIVSQLVDEEPGEWIQTSYNTKGGVYYTPNTITPDPDQSKSFRKNFAVVGGTYDRVRDAFIPPRPVGRPSFILDEETCHWVCPVPVPEDDPKSYTWDEETVSWVKR